MFNFLKQNKLRKSLERITKLEGSLSNLLQENNKLKEELEKEKEFNRKLQRKIALISNIHENTYKRLNSQIEKTLEEIFNRN